jgi:glycosyltransferase involved in cell wall biosynthesis
LIRPLAGPAGVCFVNARPKILHVVWNLIRGGTEGQCARVAMEQARQGAAVRVAVFEKIGFFLEPVEAACGPVLEVPIRRVLSIRTVGLLRRWTRWIQDEQVDLIHAWDADAAIFGAVVARWAGRPIITSHRDLGQIYARRKLRLMKWADRRAAAVVVNADAIGRWVESLGVAPEKILKILNILDVEEFDRLAAAPAVRLPQLPAGRRIGMVTRLDPEKDVETFLRAAGMVSERQPDARFVVAGDGRERTRLEALAVELGVRERVTFLGEVTEVPALLAQLQVGALVPRANEGLSNTLLEYMAASLPMVATDCGGNRELVREGETGLLVRVGDAAAVAAAFDALLARPEWVREMGRRGREQVVRDHRPAAIARQFLELYDRV